MGATTRRRPFASIAGVSSTRQGALGKTLERIEKLGNALPNPATLFAILAVAIVFLSGLLAAAGLSAKHPTTGQDIQAVSLLNVAGLHRILNETVKNFTGFAPLGVVLVAIMGIGVAEGSGLIKTALRLLVLSAPKRMLTLIVVLAGILSHVASDVGYVVVVPLAGMLFLAAGRHPLAGLAAGFAGVSGGFSANLLLGPTDVLLGGITQEAARLLNPKYTVTPVANYYFMATSAVVLTAVASVLTEKLTVPRLGDYKGGAAAETIEKLSAGERSGLTRAGWVLAALGLFVAVGLAPGGGYLRATQGHPLLASPVLHGIVALIFIGGLLAGTVYGQGAGTVKNDGDVIKSMNKSMETMASYLVLAFFAAQFVAYFSWTNLGLITAVQGADTLKSMGLQEHSTLLFFAFVVLSVALDLLIGSASAKWVLMAPVFVPMYMLLGYSPELTQAAYRIGDSVANIISPLMSYFVIIVAFVQKYEPKAGMGTVIALMLPYTVAFFIAWVGLLLLWMALGLPLGPGAPLGYVAPL